MNFDIVDDIGEIETIAKGSEISEIDRLRKIYGHGNWRKMKGIARVRLSSGRIRLAELHRYEAHGTGKKRNETQKIFGVSHENIKRNLPRICGLY